MFTGLVEEIGIIKNIISGEKSAQITIQAERIMDDMKVGDSIAVNGICLTVTTFAHHSFTVDVMPETMRVTNLGELVSGDSVNLERALRLSDRLGGHIVSGHVDGSGVLQSLQRDDNAVWLTIQAAPEIMRYVIQKGSICIDGVSLTVAAVEQTKFRVSIIPHTGAATTLLSKKAGDNVNLECDMIGKYVERLIGVKHPETNASKLDMDFLRENGFV